MYKCKEELIDTEIKGESTSAISMTCRTFRKMGNYWPGVMSSLGSIGNMGEIGLIFCLTAAVKSSVHDETSSSVSF